MRPGPWLLLSLLLSVSAAARERSGGPTLQRRTLVLPARFGELPPLTIHVAAGVATFIQLEVPVGPGTPRLPEGEARIRLVPVHGGSWILVPGTNLAEGEQVPLTLDGGPGAGPLRFSLVTRPGEADVQVRVVRVGTSADEDAAESLARQLLATPEARVTHVVPRQVMLDSGRTRARVYSVLWMGRRLFAVVSVSRYGDRAWTWKLVQVRLRATLLDGVLLEWPVRLLSGASGVGRQRHVFTSLIPEGASHLEIALDGEDAPGGFQPLPGEEEPTSP
ncbi:DUF2381 family protein [Archangium violaceum]|uniref:DUF2381 family protein n=1 Tax=Archangium violaceum TaxID=83451 RepID=UPI0037C19D07